MKTNFALKIAVTVALAFAFTFATRSAMASQAPEKGEQASAGSKQSKTVTGCLQKGDEADEYSLSANGKTYGLRSESVDLSKHVGHKVSVTGTMKPESEAGERTDSSQKNEARGAEDAGDIRVSNVTMISLSCQ